MCSILSLWLIVGSYEILYIYMSYINSLAILRYIALQLSAIYYLVAWLLFSLLLLSYVSHISIYYFIPLMLAVRLNRLPSR